MFPNARIPKGDPSQKPKIQKGRPGIFRKLQRGRDPELRKGDGPYLLRHTVVTLMLLAGEPAQAVAERVGDRVATIMAHYAHAVPGLQEKATETIAALVFGDS